MEISQANKFMKKPENRTLWIQEACGVFDEPRKTKYEKGLLYVHWDKDDDCVDVYDVRNIYGECEYGETLEFFNKIGGEKNE